MMRMLLTILTLGALLAPALPVDAQVYPDRVRAVTRTVREVARVERYQGDQRETRTERIDKTVRVGEGAELVISNIAGDIVVSRGGAGEIAVEAVKTGRGRTADEAQQALQLLQVEIVERGRRVEVRARYPQGEESRGRRRSYSGSIAFTVAVPAGTRVQANSISGDISVRDITGDLALETISGDVRVSGAGRLTKAKTASGDVEIADTSIDGALDSGSISGNVVLRNVKVERLDIGSVSGDVILENVQSSRIDAQSLSGNVRLSGPLTRRGRYDLGSHSGNIRVVVSGDTGFEVDATSFSGTIRSDLDLKSVTTEGRAQRRRSLHGVFGDGSAVLDLTTFSGNIIISR